MELVSKSVAKSRRRTLVVLVIATMLSVVAVSWWYSQRTANDLLLSDGTLVAAQVIEIDRSSRGPDEMTVTFEFNGVGHEYSIASHWFQGWNRDIVGGTIAVLYDPEHPAFVRLPDQRNYNPFSGIAALISFTLAMGVAGSLPRSSIAVAAANSNDWFPRTIAAKKGKRMQQALIESTPGTLSALVGNGAKSDLDPGPGWAVRQDRIVIAFHEPSETVLIAGLTKKAAAGTHNGEFPHLASSA